MVLNNFHGDNAPQVFHSLGIYIKLHELIYFFLLHAILYFALQLFACYSFSILFYFP